MKAAPDIALTNVIFARSDYSCAFDLEIPGGAFVALTGPSGAGKTTLLDLIAGFERAQSGRIVVGGADVTDLPPADRPVSVLFQENNLFAHLNAFDNVALGITTKLKIDATVRNEVEQALDRVGLSDFAKRLPRELSGGERQRVALARALVRRRPVLLLDEPFAALGPAMRKQMAQLVEELRREHGLTVLLVTHDPAEVADLVSHVAFIDEGRVHAFGKPSAVLGKEASHVVREYLGQSV